MSTQSHVQPGASNLAVPAPRPPLTSSAHGSESSINRVKDLPGYTTPVFKGKEVQRASVEQEVANKVRVSSYHMIVIDPVLTCHLGLHPSRTRRRRSQLVLL